MDNLEPELIMKVIAILIIIVVFLFAISVITTEQKSQGIAPSYSGSFPVTNPTVNQSCDTNNRGITSMTVTQTLNDGSIITIPAYGYSYSNTIVTVNHRLLYGD